MVIKAQALGDFIDEFTHDVTPEPEVLSKKEALEKQNQDEDLAKWKLFVDGSSNQHGCGVGLVLQTSSSEQMEYVMHIGFKTTNNEAEYKALLTKQGCDRIESRILGHLQ